MTAARWAFIFFCLFCFMALINLFLNLQFATRKVEIQREGTSVVTKNGIVFHNKG